MKSRVFIRPPIAEDCAPFISAVRISRALHRPWVSPPATKGAYHRYLDRLSLDAHRAFLVIHRESSQIAGVINLNHIIRGAFCSAFLGYYAFSNYVGQRLMAEGMRLVLVHAFRKLKLHRLEANIQPENRASIGLVRKCGFVREGLFPPLPEDRRSLERS